MLTAASVYQHSFSVALRTLRAGDASSQRLTYLARRARKATKGSVNVTLPHPTPMGFSVNLGLPGPTTPDLPHTTHTRWMDC